MSVATGPAGAGAGPPGGRGARLRLLLWLAAGPLAAVAVPLLLLWLAPGWVASSGRLAAALIAGALLGLGVAAFAATRLIAARRTLAQFAQVAARGRAGDDDLDGAVRELVAQLAASRDASAGVADRATGQLREEIGRLRARVQLLEDQLRAAREDTQSKGELLGSMSHELRTPLTAILGYADLLAKGELSREQADQVLTLRRSAQGLLAMINDLLDWSRIEGGKLRLQEIGFNLADCVEDTVSLLAPLAYDKQLELVHIIYHDVPLRLRGDPARLQQVLTNLLSNAIKFTDRGEVVLRVMKEREDRGRIWLRMSVSDTGAGMSDAQVARLFEDYSPASASAAPQPPPAGGAAGRGADGRSIPSTGLGLAITRKLLALMDGSIQVESRAGVGSTFSVTFAAGRQAEREQAIIAWDALRGVRAWLLEPHPTARLALVHCLEYWGMALRVFESPVELGAALQRADAEKPDLVIAGAQAADQDSGTLAAAITAARGGPPVLVLTAAISPSVHDRFMRMGARAVLPKSASRPVLYRELSDLALSAGGGKLPRAPLEGVSVLVADNNVAGRRYMANLVARLGGEPIEAQDGEEALARWAELRPRFLLLDVHMPRRSGPDVSREVRAREGAERHSVVLAVSAYLEPAERNAALLSGMDDVLIHPFDERALLRALSPWLRRRREPPQGPVPMAGANRLADPEMLGLLETELPLQLRQLEDAYRDADTRALRDAAHQLHGSAAFYRLKNLKQAAARLETRLAQPGNSDGGVREDVTAIRAAVNETLSDLRPRRAAE